MVSTTQHIGRTKTTTDTWLTPPDIIKALGIFDLDPCSPIERPWDTATKHYSLMDDGLTATWAGRVWLNPPYGRGISKWLEKMALHNNGIALICSRTETKWFQDCVFPHADAIFFFRGRLRFYDVNGQLANSSAPAPNCLIAYGEANTQSIVSSGLHGTVLRGLIDR